MSSHSDNDFFLSADLIPLAISIIKDDRFIHVNTGWNKLTGYSKSEALGLNPIELVHPDMCEALLEYISRVTSGNEAPERLELKLGSRSGEMIWVDIFLSQIEFKGIEAILMIAVDITQKKKTEETLEKSKQKLRSTLASMDDLLFVLSKEEVLVEFYQPSSRPDLYTEPKNFLGKKFSDILPDDVASLIEDGFRRTRTTSGPVQVDYELDLPIGHRWFSAKMSPRKDISGNFDGVIIVVRDMSSHREILQRLNTISQAIEQSPSSAVITNPDGDIEYVNRSFLDITGYTADEVIGKNPRILQSGYTRLEEYKRLWDTITSGKTWKGEFRNKKKNGEIFWDRTIIGPILDENGTIRHFVSVREDITRQKKLEEQLIQSQKMEAIGHLAGGIAHDFNNILTVINGYSDILLRELDTASPFRNRLLEIHRAGRRAETLTRQLLAFSRKQILKPVMVDINRLINDMEKMLGRIIGEDIDLVLNLNSHLLSILADPGQIEQVILNLVVNSRDAMPTGGTICIETDNVLIDEEYTILHPGSVPGMHVMIAVSDNGCGMHKEIVSRIFEPFFSTKERGKGTGLGLSTVYGIVKQSKGSIYVYSEPGDGTSFKVYFEANEWSASSGERLPEGKKKLTGKETILVVEDDDAVRELIVSALESFEYKVIEAASGEIAIRIVRDSEPLIDVLLTDVIMPEMSGTELSDKLFDISPGTIVIFMSGYTDNAIVHHGILDTNVNFIEKPFTPVHLAEKIREILDSRSS